MATNYTSHSRIVYANYDDIKTAVENGTLNANDVVFCKDTHQMCIITNNNDTFVVNSRHYRFENLDLATEGLNAASDTYEGQIVSVRNTYTGLYDCYVVNKEDGAFALKNLAVADSVQFDYNKALNKPIDVLKGTVFSPIVIDTLSDGFYKLTGAYKLSDDIVTVYATSSGHFLMVETIGDTKHIKQITADKIIDYTIKDGEVTSAEMPTKQWVLEQNFATEKYVDDKLAAMNFFTKSDAEAYISQYIDASISDVVADTVDRVVDERFSACTEDEITNLVERNHQ